MAKLFAVVLLILSVVMAAPVEAGVLTDVYDGKARAAVFQGKVFSLPIYVGSQMVSVDRCVDGIRVWYTRTEKQTDDNLDSRIVRIREAVRKSYPTAHVATSSDTNCPDNPRLNRVRIWHTGQVGDLGFFDAVEKALNELGIGKVVVAQVSSGSSDWAVEVRTGKAGAVLPANFCSQLEEFVRKDFTPEHPAPSRDEAIRMAKGILAVFKLPVLAREDAQRCFVGRDRHLGLTESGRLMGILVTVLETAGAKPQDIGVTADGLRQTLLNDIKGQVAYIRKAFQEGRGSSSDYLWPRLLETAGDGVKNWGFTPAQLGLTPSEAQELQGYLQQRR